MNAVRLCVTHACGCSVEYLIDLKQGTPAGARRWFEARPCPRCAKKEAKCQEAWKTPSPQSRCGALRQ